MDLIIKNGTVVTSSDTFVGDVGIAGDKIVALGAHIEHPQAQILDARGKLVLPGCIDVHTHMQLPFMGNVTIDDFELGSQAAACGGVTCFVDFAIQAKGETLIEAIEKRRAVADGHVHVDYSLHAGITDPTDEVLASIPKVIEYGVPSFKLFMIYFKEGWMINDGALHAILLAAREHGALVGVHAENPFILDYNVDKFKKEGKLDMPWHGRARPNFVEAEAIRRAIFLTEQADSRLYIFHMSTKEGVQLVAEAKGRGVAVFAETGPHYLLLTEKCYETPDGLNYLAGPPLRKEEDNAALWRGLSTGAVQVLATDHCAFSRAQKMSGGGQDFTKVPNGLPGIETLLPLTYSEGVRKGRISLNQMVELLSANPAKLFGLHPHKGSLAPGADADVVLLDPEKTQTISPEVLHTKMDFNPFTGMKVTGWPVLTISRGRILWKDDQFQGDATWGRFVRRSYQGAEVGTEELVKA